MTDFFDSSKPIFIESIVIDRLFGNRTVEINSEENLYTDSKILLLHGMNGSGKTTLLNILYHLLSCATSAGHKSSIAKIPFRSTTIQLSNGLTIEAYRRHGGLKGSFTMSFISPEGINNTEQFKSDSNLKVSIDDQPDSQDKFLKELSEHVPDVYYMSDNRQFNNDRYRETLERQSNLVRHQRYVDERNRHSFDTEFHYGAIDYVPADDSLSFQLDTMLQLVRERIRHSLIEKSDQGQEDASNIYKRVIKTIANPYSPELATDNVCDNLLIRLANISRTSSLYSDYGLSSAIDTSDFAKSITDMTKSTSANEKLELVLNVLNPYVESAESRLSSLKPIFDLVDNFIDTTNRLLVDKHMTFSTRKGFGVQTDQGDPLTTANLSSGEKHLMMILSSTLLANTSSSVLLIDEPEMSLNPTWQQNLISSMIRCSPQANTQFVLATHSHDILSQYSEFAVRL